MQPSVDKTVVELADWTKANEPRQAQVASSGPQPSRHTEATQNPTHRRAIVGRDRGTNCRQSIVEHRDFQSLVNNLQSDTLDEPAALPAGAGALRHDRRDAAGPRIQLRPEDRSVLVRARRLAGRVLLRAARGRNRQTAVERRPARNLHRHAGLRLVDGLLPDVPVGVRVLVHHPRANDGPGRLARTGRTFTRCCWARRSACA